MKVLMLEASQAMLDERRANGLDRRDEMWDGVLHMVPPAKDAHQDLSLAFIRVAAPLAEARGLVARFETGLFRDAGDFRVPDQLYRLPEHGSERGAEGAELVVEIRSPEDETYRKLTFYAELGVREVLVLHPAERRAELFTSVDGQLLPVSADSSGSLRCEVLGISLTGVAGRLRIEWPGGSAEI